jgi:membrane associated rhomboid family serine protease
MEESVKHQERNKLILAFFYPSVFVFLLWLIKIAEFAFNWPLSDYGLIPRNLNYLFGIFTMPFLHSGISHLFSNSGPLLILGGFIFYFYREVAWKVLLWIYLLSGSWLWLGGRTAMHIGASGLVYGFAAFLFFSGIFKKSTALMTVSLVIIFLYGSMVWGFFPEFFPKENISWEGHLFGFIAGLLMAVYFRNDGPKKTTYQWLEDDELETDDEFWKADLPSDKSALDENAHPTHFKHR